MTAGALLGMFSVMAKERMKEAAIATVVLCLTAPFFW